jgi:hypothetical protein
MNLSMDTHAEKLPAISTGCVNLSLRTRWWYLIHYKSWNFKHEECNAKLFINKTAEDKVWKSNLPLLGYAFAAYGDDFYFSPFPYSSRERKRWDKWKSL